MSEGIRPEDGTDGPAADDGDLPLYTELPVEASVHNPPRTELAASRVVVVLMTVLALVSAMGFALVSVGGSGGSESPETAVEALFASLENEDLVGVLESLPPSERSIIRDGVVDIVAQLQRLGILDQFDLHDVPGADIEIDGLRLSSTQLGPDMVAVRIVDGTISGRAFPDQIPIGEAVERFMGDDLGEGMDITDETFSERLGDGDLELVALREHGSWHVSLFYSIAEAARGDGPVPDFGHGLTPLGAATPEAAVRDLVAAAADFDAERAIRLLPPDEMRVLYDYGPLFLDDARQAADEAKEEGVSITVDRLDLRSEGSGATRRVFVEGFDGRAVIDPDFSVHVAYDGTCVTYEATFPSRRFLPSTSRGGRATTSSENRTESGKWCEGQPLVIDGEEADSELTMGSGLFGTLSDAGITTVERDGRWYVSPTRSLFDNVLAWLRGVTREDVDRFFDSWPDMFGYRAEARFEAVGEAVGDDEPGPSGPPGTTRLFNDPCFEPLDALPPDATEDDWEAAAIEVGECMNAQWPGGGAGTTVPAPPRRGPR